LPDSIAQVFDKRPYRSSSKNIVNEVCRMLSVDPDDLHKKGRANDLSSAKGLICYLGYYQLGINGKELARYFGISRPSVSQAIKRGAARTSAALRGKLLARQVSRTVLQIDMYLSARRSRGIVGIY
jgi:DNA-binding Xre family transcriptional regulator